MARHVGNVESTDGVVEMKNFAVMITAIIFMLLPSAAITQTDRDMFNPSPIISQALKDLDSIRTLLAEVQNLDENPGRFRRSRSHAQRDLDNMLDSLVVLIVGESYAKARKDILHSEALIIDLEKKVDELNIERLTAPASEEKKSKIDSILMREFSPGSREDIDVRISKITEQIEKLRENRFKIEGEFRDFLLKNYGIMLTTDQVRAVLYQINGSSIVEAAITYSVLQSIETRLGEIRSSIANQETLRRYYGVAAIMRLIKVRLHERHLHDYSDAWIPALQSFEKENNVLILETQNLITKTRQPEALNMLRNNLIIQNRVSEVVDEYRKILMAREAIVKERLIYAISEAEVAINTLRTLDNALIIFEQFSDNEVEFQALMEVDSNQLIPLDQEEMIEDFLSISRALAGS